MFSTSYTIGTIFKIPIRLHITLLIPLFWALNSPYVFHSLLFVAAILTSITLHELAHCYFAQRFGCRVKEIKLTLIGGIASINEMPKKASQEIIMAAAGPIASISIGISLITLASLSPEAITPWYKNLYSNNLTSYSLSATFLLGTLNLIIGTFNLIPAIPLDGGRILRAALTRKQGYVKATFTAMRIGKIVAVLLGILALRRGSFSLLIIAVFIYVGAAKEYLQARMREMSGDTFFSYDSSIDDDEVEISASPWQKNKGKRKARIKRL